MKFLLVLVIAVLAFQYKTFGKRPQKLGKFDYLSDDAEIVSVTVTEVSPPEISECTCKCCEQNSECRY